MVTKKQDTIYASPLNEIVDFQFDDQVVDVFPDMINRSVPGYGLMVSTIGVLAGQYAQTGTRCYDLGCSLGAVSFSMRQHLAGSNCEIVSVDNSQVMIDRAAEFPGRENPSVPLRLVCDDILNTPIDNASVVVLNLTLQFIPLARRLELLQRVYAGLRSGGVLILSEKLAFTDEDRQDFQQQLHESFKRAQGYSDLEISQKRTALEKVMIPESLQTHKRRLTEAGFGFVDVWFQCLNFASLAAIK